MADPTVETVLHRLGVLDRLVVESYDLRNGDLVVIDPQNPSDRYHLVETEPGRWAHIPAGVSGTLGHVLRAIAWASAAEEETDRG